MRACFVDPRPKSQQKDANKPWYQSGSEYFPMAISVSSEKEAPGRSAQSGMGRENQDTGQSSEDLANMGKYLHSPCTSPHSSLEQAPVTTPGRGQVSTAVNVLPRIFSAISPPPYTTPPSGARASSDSPQLRSGAMPPLGQCRWCARARPGPRWLHV